MIDKEEIYAKQLDKACVCFQTNQAINTPQPVSDSCVTQRIERVKAFQLSIISISDAATKETTARLL